MQLKDKIDDLSRRRDPDAAHHDGCTVPFLLSPHRDPLKASGRRPYVNESPRPQYTPNVGRG